MKIGRLTIELKVSWNNKTKEEPYMTEVKDALMAGYKVEAVKIYKNATGLGLRESKDFIDALCPMYYNRFPDSNFLAKYQATQLNK